MIEERHVNFEIARLLKDKGFHELCHKAYHYYGYALSYHHKEKDFNGEEYSKLNTEWYSAPSLAMVMAWLREVHNLHIIICVDDLDWSYQIVNFKNKLDVQYIKDLAGFNSYENAADAAILECLTNLI